MPTRTNQTNQKIHSTSTAQLLNSFMQHLTRPLPLHRTLFAPIPFAPLAPLEPLHAKPSQRVASVWAAPPPAPLAAQQPRPQALANAPLLPLYSNSYGSDSISDTEFVPLEQQGRHDAAAAAVAATTQGVEQKPFSK